MARRNSLVTSPLIYWFLIRALQAATSLAVAMSQGDIYGPVCSVAWRLDARPKPDKDRETLSENAYIGGANTENTS